MKEGNSCSTRHTLFSEYIRVISLIELFLSVQKLRRGQDRRKRTESRKYRQTPGVNAVFPEHFDRGKRIQANINKTKGIFRN